MNGTHPVIAALRTTLATSRIPTAFARELEDRIRQLLSNMVDGRVLPKPDAEALRASLFEFLRTEALPKLADRNPKDALAILGMLKMYGYTQLESARAQLEAMRAAKFPPPKAATWPELTELREAVAKHPDVCSMGSPVQSVDVVQTLTEGGLELPNDLLALYAWADGVDLSCLADPYIPVFSLLPSHSVEVADPADGYPRRAVIAQGGDAVQFSVYRDRGQWRLVYEYTFRPLATKPLDLRELVRFGIRRMHASSADALFAGELSWDQFFGVSGS